ncbi:hypothetical protein BH10PSE6_BH10PSE6_23900 [soil metagenome]
MRCIVRRLTLAAAAILASAGSAGAQNSIDMKGTWVGTGLAIVSGPAQHHPSNEPSKPADNHRLTELEYTVIITGQDGRRFWGTGNSKYRKGDRIIGSLSTDGKQIHWVGDEGYSDGTIMDSDTFDACYRHVNDKSALVTCFPTSGRSSREG